MNQKSLDKQDWEKRYAEKFPNIHGRKLPLQLKSFIQSELDRQRKEILLNYFGKEDDLADNYANLKDDNWSNFLEERSKLKIKSLQKQ